MIDTLYECIMSMSPELRIIKSPLSNLLQKINTICVLCSESMHIQSLLKNALQETLDLLMSRRGSVFMLDDQTKGLVLRAGVGMEVGEEEEMIRYLEQGIVDQAAQLKEPFLVEYKSGSFICCPLMIKSRLIGVINIFDKLSRKPFTQRELQLLNFLSNQIALNYQRISMADQLEFQERLVSLGKLAGGIAHDFNNPLDGVMRYTNLCLSHAQSDEVLQEYLMEIQTGLKRMANIVKNLLACARQLPASPYKVNVCKIIEQALKELSPYLASKNIDLVKNFSENLPEIIDLGVERIISSLVKNAIDAIDKNGTIEITASANDGYFKLQVADTGAGISEENLEKIFEPFFTTKNIDQGSGLGLTIVNEIIRCYNGKINVKSHLDQGTTFTVELPVTP